MTQSFLLNMILDIDYHNWSVYNLAIQLHCSIFKLYMLIPIRSEKYKEVSKVCVQFLTKAQKIVWVVNWDSNKILGIQFINPFAISGIVASQTKRPFKSLFYVVEIYSSTCESPPEVSLCLSRTIPSNSPEPGV